MRELRGSGSLLSDGGLTFATEVSRRFEMPLKQGSGGTAITRLHRLHQRAELARGKEPAKLPEREKDLILSTVEGAGMRGNSLENEGRVSVSDVGMTVDQQRRSGSFWGSL